MLAVITRMIITYLSRSYHTRNGRKAKMSQSLKVVINHALFLASDPTPHRDLTTRELNLTQLEECVMEHLQISDEEFEDRDLSYEIWRELDKRGMLPEV
jgi:hypothetical protein